MNHIFHTRIVWHQYLFLVVVGLLAFHLLWIRAILLAAVCMLLLVVFIERFIHTTYTVTTEGMLILYMGRFSKSKNIAIKDIVSVEKRYLLKIGSFYLTSYLLIHYSKDKYVSVLPVKEREFIDTVEKEQKKCN
ncbi:PH domain-containing protein [Bacteroides sp. 224]|uniref:PH domain-containing protein n=1 Tax=Bacteroides sp. 224 TaxID=2302936 RepID=UPI0013D228BD|nr:PH domain-containing protein [Bacteroides sp. 224]NDV65736.1 ABC transporter [Bacteroides sp. 224]